MDSPGGLSSTRSWGEAGRSQPGWGTPKPTLTHPEAQGHPATDTPGRASHANVTSGSRYIFYLLLIHISKITLGT